MKSTYKHLEHLHYKHGLMLHTGVFVFSLLVGIGIGILAFTFNAFQAKLAREEMRRYETKVMEQIVSKVEAAPLILPEKAN
ncbi:hypothetical protein HYW54_00610 [Candidatus Gottesmanbacteria bacterium]|nr:hypothetical protein [Candidatus Gottesmanbacteria bacterium]